MDSGFKYLVCDMDKDGQLAKDEKGVPTVKVFETDDDA